jgi:hypothetical protein
MAMAWRMVRSLCTAWEDSTAAVALRPLPTNSSLVVEASTPCSPSLLIQVQTLLFEQEKAAQDLVKQIVRWAATLLDLSLHCWIH